MTDPEDNFILGKNVFDNNSHERKFWSCLGQTCSDCVSVPTLCLFVDHLWLLLENSSFKNFSRTNCLGWNCVRCSKIHFTFTKIMNKVISTKSRVFTSLVGPSKTGKSQLIYKWLKIGILQPKFDKIYFF